VTINRLTGEVMEKITTVGLDLAKQVVAVHAVGADGQRVMRKVLRRDQLLRWTATLPRCVVAMEAQAARSDVAQRLQTIAGVGPTTAAAMVANVGEP
jgi:transposase